MKPKVLSCFLCRELLYEYATKTLNEIRRQSVEHHLSWCRDCDRNLKELQKGLEYLSSLSLAKIATKAVQELKEKNRFATPNVGSKHLHESLRWGLEALVAALIVGASFHFGSQWWANHKNQTTLAEPGEVDTLPKEAGASQPLPEDTLAEIDIESDEESGGVPEPSPYTTHSDEIGNESVAGPNLQAGTDMIDAAPNSGTPFVTSAKPLVVALDSANAPAPLAPNTNAPTATPFDTVENGLVYRLSMKMSRIDRVTPEIIKTIGKLEGQKAGQVQLGWRKPDGSYFHFTLPEKNFELFKTKLRSFAQVQQSKDPHKRVMPAGTIRIILWIEEMETPISTARPVSTIAPAVEETVEATETPKESDLKTELPLEPIAPETEETPNTESVEHE